MYPDRSVYLMLGVHVCHFPCACVNADMHTHTHAQSQTFLSRSYSNRRRGGSLAEGRGRGWGGEGLGWRGGVGGHSYKHAPLKMHPPWRARGCPASHAEN